MVQFWIQQRPALVSQRDMFGNSPLYTASRIANSNAVAWILAIVPNAEYSDQWEMTILYLAVFSNNISTVKSVYAAYPENLHQKDACDCTPMHHATENSRCRDIAKFFKKHILIDTALELHEESMNQHKLDLFTVFFDLNVSTLAQTLHRELVDLVCDYVGYPEKFSKKKKKLNK